ncbi:MAG TPA: PAS domain S-box protein [Pirellulaceae bacterium]|jgi:PAS domain S-box-containing protein|nr:PAS domain S-box protein [Pirellulaceae bacterium]
MKEGSRRGSADQAELFRLLVENVFDYAIFVIDSEGRVQTWSEGAARLLGYREDEILGQLSDKLFTPDDVLNGVPAKERRQALATGRGEDDRWHIKKDGSRFWSGGAMTPLWDESGTLRGFAKIMRDRTEWKLAEEARLESEARRAAVLETSLDGILTIDSDDRIVEFNAAAERIFGYRRADVLGRKLAELIVPERLRRAHYDGMARYLATGEGPVLGKRLKLPALRGDGTEFPVELAIARVPGAGPPLFTGYVRDISEQEEQERRRAAQLAVTEALAQASTVRDAAPRILKAVCEGLGWDVGAFWLFDQQAQVLRCLEVWHTPTLQVERFENASREQVFAPGDGLPGRVWGTGRPVWIADVSLDSNFPRLALSAEAGLHGAFAVPILLGAKALGVIEFLSRPVREPDADLLRVMATIGGQLGQFVERKRSEERLRQSEERFRQLAENVNDVFWVTDAIKSELLYVSPAFERVWGRTCDSLYKDPRSLIEAVYAEDRETVIAALARQARGETTNVEYRIVRPDGIVRWIWDRGFPVRDDCGTVYRVAGVAGDVTERKLAEATLAEGAARLRRIVESNVVGLIVADFRGRVLEANDAFLGAIGYTQDDLRSGRLNFLDLTPAEHRPLDERAMAEMTAAGRHAPYEKEYVRKDGSRVPVLVGTSYLGKDPEGSELGVGFILDLTESKKAERALRESEEKFRHMADTIPQLAWMAGPDGHIFWYNRRWYEYTGTTPEQMEGWGWQSIHDPLELPKVLERWKRSIASGEPFDMVFPLKGADGLFRPFLTRVNPLRGEGGIRYWFGTNTDISEQKRAEDASRFLADASAALASVLDCRSTLEKVAWLAVPRFGDWCAVHLVEPDGSLRRLAVAHADPSKVQLAYELLRRYPPDPSVLVGAAHVARTGESELSEEINDSLLAAADRDEERLRILRQIGLKSYVCVPMKVRGKTLGVLTFVAAESSRRYSAAELALAEELAARAAVAVENTLLYDELREADRRKDEFLAMLAHELRNPLAPIRSGLDLLGLIGTDGQIIEPMQQQVEHLVRLVDDLLDVSRIMRGKVELRKEPVNLSSVVARAVATARPLIEAHGHEFSLELPPEPVPLDADPVRLAQVIGNLLINAAKYTPDGGRIRLSAQAANGDAVVEVSDTGIGIEPDLLPRVFDLFTQAERTVDRSQGGLGIGLTLVKSLVELHGGSVSAHSEGPGRGSQFAVRLQVSRESAPKAGGGKGIDATGAYRILIVDDNVAAAKMLSMLIARLGDHEVFLTHDGPSALAAAKELSPDIILLDIGLPRMDGYEVAHRLRQQPEFERTLVVALTGYGTEEDRRKSLHAGCDDHLVKPPSVDALKRVLNHPKLPGT